MMPLPWLKQVSVSYRCWRYWPFIFLVSDRYQILRYRNTAIPPLYIVRAHTVRTLMERTKLQSRTNRELVGIRGLLSLNSEHSNRPSVICQITGWWMVPPADALGRWSLWCETLIASHCSLQYDSFFVFQSATAAKATNLLNLGTDYRGVSWR